MSMFYVNKDESRSMMHERAIVAEISSGEITAQTMVWSDGWPKWKPIGEVDNFKSILAEHDPSLSATAAARQSVEKAAEKWYYIDEKQAQMGPFEVSIIRSLIGNGTVKTNTLVWCPSLSDTWAKAGEVDDIKHVFADAKKQKNDGWFYTDKYRAQKGPVLEGVLSQLLVSKDITEDTLVWKEGMRDWLPLKDIPSLATLALNALLPPEARVEMGEAGSNGGDAKISGSGGGEKGGAGDEKVGQKRKRKKKKNKKWKKFENTPHVYVTGLPKDVTRDEIHDHFKKAGIIDTALDKGPKIKIYMDKTGKPKGDGLVSYMKMDSVPLAIELLNDSQFRPGITIKVSKAEFQQKGDKFIEKKLTKTDLKFKRFKKQQALDWDEDGVNQIKGFRIVVLKHMFTPEEAKPDKEKFYRELEAEVGSEIESKCGDIDKLTVFENNPDGVIAVKFKSGQAAAECIKVMHNRYFGQRKIECVYFDGKTNYKVGESAEDLKEREEAYSKWMMGEGDSKS
uniref:RRM domain-containing protein n=1 Tax=Amorphochlora amoebiformis TaxID=1561963 RepID=A0A7S0GK02_9EUKA